MPDLSQSSDPDDTKSRFAREVVARLRGAGFAALWAGGCVRDLLLGMTPTDYDVATNATPSAVMALFPRTVPVGVSFGVVRVLGPRGGDEIEVATFRSDGTYLDGRRPETVTFGNAEDDARRRDFTINGMFLDPFSNDVIDYVGGQADLKAGLVRAIGEPAMRFSEDKLRLLRAVRFTARLGFRLDAATRAALEQMAGELRSVAAERVAEELRRMLLHETRAAAMELALETGLLAAFLPDVAGLAQVDAPPNARNQTLWTHTVEVLRRLTPEAEPGFPLALAALLHELDHPERAHAGGKDCVQAICRTLRLSNDVRLATAWLVAHQRDLWALLERPIAARKRMLAHERIADLIALHRADAEAAGASTEVLDRIQAYRRDEPEGPINPPLLVKGDDLRALGVAPGPRIKRLLDRARDAQLANQSLTREELLSLVSTWVDEEGS